ncbi:hypothetical protein IQ249_18625 [Lusitaniella coriacea LEGE 07157]|uniref:Nucleotidyltransferase family protein n=1 Tax=Lusitaniella coriacea LEGE 07157 TaxID=945747 RepID=A0A8J7DZY4_9CYAN|nr:hypothetical protein [Lusitaniella coriacea]MBE9117916.1 hypothetical protein [Lusitaniella coriacea LEGE 07157]
MNATPTPPNYRTQAADTAIEVDIFEFALLRKKSNRDRALLTATLTRGARQLCLCGLKHTHRNLSQNAFAQLVARAFLGDDNPPTFLPGGDTMTWIQDSLELTAQLHELFETHQIPYYITGGVASTTYGEPRTTRDLDVVISLQTVPLNLLVSELEKIGFYVLRVEDVRARRMRTLGITHTTTIARADLIMADDTEFDRVKFSRHQAIDIPNRDILYFASPEDVILNKLRWGQASQSEKQWRDVLGILKVQTTQLDLDYLNHWANRLKLTPILLQAFNEAGLTL